VRTSEQRVPVVDVVVLTYGRSETHVPLVASLLDGGLEPDALTLVHNPASETECAPTAPAGVRVLRMTRNLGYAGAMNRGVVHGARAGSDLVLLLTHDVRLPFDGLRRLVTAAETNPRCGILGAVLHESDTRKLYSVGGYVRPDGLVGHLKNPGPELSPGIAAADWVDGSMLLIRKDALHAVGYLDERFFMYFEETDLCRRVRAAGWHVGVVTDVAAETSPGHAGRAGAYSYLFCRNGLEYALRSYGVVGLVRTARARARELRRAARRAARGESEAIRRDARAEFVGTVTGMSDFVLRRWGPPPGWLPGRGDIVTTRRSRRDVTARTIRSRRRHLG
jgi:GT2 family glycosyltransferase